MMSENSKNNMKAVLVCLHKAFTHLDSIIKIWSESNVKAEQHAKSIANLLEQLESCARVKRRDVPAIEDIIIVKERLVDKIRATIDEDAMELKINLSDMEGSLSQVGGILRDTRRTLDGYSDIDFNDLTVATSAIRPSVFLMLEWFQDIARHMEQEYQSKKSFAGNLSSFSSECVLKLVKDWQTHSLQASILSEIWPHLQFFLKENLTN